MLLQNVSLHNKVILITGAAGFVGANLVMSLFNNIENSLIIGVDSVNDYYDVSLKEYRLQQIVSSVKHDNQWIFKKGNIADKEFLQSIFDRYKPDVVVNLAAQDRKSVV